MSADVGPAVRPELTAPLVRALDWALTHERGATGEVVCPEHGVEHTGKTANLVILAAELLRHTGEARFADVARRLALRVASRLEREGDSPCFTFRPGRHDPYNCSNSVIDGGACADALALVASRGDELGLTSAERHELELASLRHAQSYLRFAAVDKGIPAQRAWALTGLAWAPALAAKDDGALAREAFERFDGCTEPEDWPDALRAAAGEALARLRAFQRADGSYPYHPHTEGPGHPGAADASAFYQSRVTGFVLFALDRLGEDPLAGPHRASLEAGLAFLVGLYGPDGLKAGLVEAKPWYWGATYEVASHAFDVQVLAEGWARLGDGRAGALALAAYRRWAEHLTLEGPDAGMPTSHRPGPGRCPSYQCELFWASHACWTARVLPLLERLAVAEAAGELPPPVGPRVEVFADTGLARLEAGGLAAFVRGARPPGNVNHGSVHGAGLLRVAARAADEAGGAAASAAGRHGGLVPRCRMGGANQAELAGKAGGISPGRGWRAGKDEVRFALWTARVHWRAGRKLDALLDVPRAFRRAVLAFAHPRVSTAFARDVQLEVEDDGVRLVGHLAWRDGTPVPGSRVERAFRMTDAGLEVTERLVAAGAARGLVYRRPGAAAEGAAALPAADGFEDRWTLASPGS